jgi:hypothetical protein
MSSVDIVDNNIYGAAASHATPLYINTSLPSGRIVNNVGINPVQQYAQGNVTGATTFTRVNGNSITATLVGNVTLTLPNALVSGEVLYLELTQDGTGGRSITKPANVKLVGGAFSPTAAASATDSWTLKNDGTNWIEVGRALNVS